MFIISKNIKKYFFRKLKPPIPILKNKLIKILNTPKIFEDNQSLESETIDTEKYFNNWSFVKSDN